jgi:molybdate transport system substrate-binding protein
MGLRSGVVLGVLLLAGCSSHQAEPSKLTVAAAANLTDVFGEIGKAFTAKTGTEVVFSFGSTAQLAQQIDNGAPFDVFAAADTEHVDSLVKSGKIVTDSRAVYAIGQLAMWSPSDAVKDLKDLAEKKVRFVSVAQPGLAPYGEATVQALKAAGLWEQVQPKIVYSNNISLAKQLAASGNADAAFTAYSLVLHEKGNVVKVDPGLYRPIEQALGLVASSKRVQEAKQFREFVLGPAGKAILEKSGYAVN